VPLQGTGGSPRLGTLCKAGAHPFLCKLYFWGDKASGVLNPPDAVGSVVRRGDAGCMRVMQGALG